MMQMQAKQEQSPAFLQQIVGPLLNWYDNNARILPWRQSTEPYAIWVSEIMLQQTRVEVVIPYYKRFMQALPTVQSLAFAKEELLLKLWEGLGYYRRVRNLQKAAQRICAQFDGIFPNTYEEILLLPGVGPYTAGAIASIAFGRPTPAVDGNVLRVIARLTENDGDIGSAAIKKQITADLAAIYPKKRSGDFTQSLMELGALICTPNGAPKCALCPLAHLCRAYANDTQMLLPVKAAKEARRQEKLTVFLLCDGESIALQKRGQGILLAGLWELPNTIALLNKEEISQWLQKHGIRAQTIVKTGVKKHIFTHVEWEMHACVVQVAQREAAALQFLWANKKMLEAEIALPTAFKKLLGYWQNGQA